MNLYSKTYLQVLKKNFILLMITIALLFFTFAFWIGVPVYIISDILSKFKTPQSIQNISILIGIGFLFSIFFIPINFKVAEVFHKIKSQNFLPLFIRIHLGFILFATIFFSLIFYIIILIEKSSII